PADHLFCTLPFAEQREIYAEIVICDEHIEGMLGLIEEFDRFFETLDAVIRFAKEPVCPGHIRVELAEHKWRRIRTDDLDSELKTLDRLLAVAFLIVNVRDLAIRLGHPEPVTGRAEMVQSFLSKIAADRKFVELSVNAGEGDVDRPEQMRMRAGLRPFEHFL